MLIGMAVCVFMHSALAGTPVDVDAMPDIDATLHQNATVTTTPPVDSESLARNGPQFPISQSVGTFNVEGFVRGGWPFVIDFKSQLDTCTWLEITTDEKTTWSRILDVDGSAGRHILEIDLPQNLASEPRPAQYAIYSTQPACAPGAEAVPEKARRYLPILVYGIGGGPRAVGSVAVNKLQFGPPTPQFPREVATFDYVTESDFGRVSEEILSYRQAESGQWTVVLVHALQLYATIHGTHHGNWDGTGQAGNRMAGIYRLQVRAWNTVNDEKSWVGAISQDSVRISRP